MKFLRRALFGGLALYSILLFVGELLTSQHKIRVFFSDVRPPGVEMWFGFNTTLAVALFWGTATLFAVAWRATDLAGGARRLRVFYVSQVLFFLYLGGDDRFTFHETLGGALPFEDAWILLALGVTELVLLALWMPRAAPRLRAARWLIGAAICFVVSTGIDAFVASEVAGRLAVEDLSKTWAGALLFAWAWELLGIELQQLRTPDVAGA